MLSLQLIFHMVHRSVIWLVSIKAKQPESGDLCGNITEFGGAEGSHLHCRLR